MTIPPTVRDAPYSAALAAEPGWRDVVRELEVLLADRDILLTDIERTLYIRFEFMDRRPSSMGVYGEPNVTLNDFPTRYNSDIYEVLEDALCPTLDDHPMHFAMFRHKGNKWQAARVVDAYKETWNQWRASRSQCQNDRLEWFKLLAVGEFEAIHVINLFIMIDQETTEQKIVPLLVGVDKKSVWMMTSGFSDRLDPYSGKDWAELPSCNAEVLYRCAREQLGDAVNSVQDLTNSLEVAAITQVAEAFYWSYVDGLDKRAEDSQVDFFKPQRHHTLSKHSSSAQALETDTPFLLTRYTRHGQIPLTDGRRVTPALITVEGALSSNLNPSINAVLKGATGSLGKAPKAFKGPVDIDLFTLVRDEVAAYGKIHTPLLERRLCSFAALEFHFDRFLPEDLAPHVDQLYLAEFGDGSLVHHQRQVVKYDEFDSTLHDRSFDERPLLSSLQVYKGLKTLDLRSSVIDDLSWLGSVDWLEELLLSDATVEDFSPLGHASELRQLDLAQTSLKSLAPLLSLDKLESLSLNSVQIADIGPLSSLTSLKRLALSHMPVRDISALAALPELEEVLLAGIDNIEDYSVLSRLPNLKLLSIAQTRIADLSVLPDMPELETLYIWDCVNLNDLAPLDRYKNLGTVNSRGTGIV